MKRILSFAILLTLTTGSLFSQGGGPSGKRQYDHTNDELLNPTIINPTITGGTDASKKAVTVISGDGAITIATGQVVLTKGSAAAITLAAPTAAQNGTIISVSAGSAFAHVITATGLIDDGVTGGAKTTATFGAFVGSTITLVAYNLHWIVVSKNIVTIT
jgi:hypothetical protein